MRQVKVEVLGVMDAENKLVRLRAIEPLQILEPLENWVEKDSIILTDFTVDKGTLHTMGFTQVYQVSVSEASSANNKFSNQNVMEYLRRIVPRMFQNTLSLLSRQIIQQFLDELVWRERWGPIAAQAFDNIILHIAEQTKLDTGESLVMRLSKVAANPFKQWNYAAFPPPSTQQSPSIAAAKAAQPRGSMTDQQMRVATPGRVAENLGAHPAVCAPTGTMASTAVCRVIPPQVRCLDPTALHYAARTKDLGTGLAPANSISRRPMPVKEGMSKECKRRRVLASGDHQIPFSGRWPAGLKSPLPHRPLSGAEEGNFFESGETSDHWTLTSPLLEGIPFLEPRWEEPRTTTLGMLLWGREGLHSGAGETNPIGTTPCSSCNQHFAARVLLTSGGEVKSEMAEGMYSAYCTVCRTSLTLSNMGKRTLRSHMAGKKHVAAVFCREQSASFKTFLNTATKPDSQCVNQTSSTEAAVAPCSSYSVVQVAPHFELKPPVSLSAFVLKEKSGVLLFPLMFPDSEIASKLNLHKTKIDYTILYGLAPYFHGGLLEMCSQCQNFVAGFDESLNEVCQKGQMDVMIRFWSDKDNEVCTRYFGSVFLGHTTAADLLDGFIEALGWLDVKKFMQVLMDGPNVNKKFLQDLKLYLKGDPDSPVILNLGTCELHTLRNCGLHTLHNSYKAAIKKTDWGNIESLRALHYLFSCVPVRRADYVQFSGSNVFPFTYCKVRWLKNVKVVERTLSVLPHVEKYVQAVKLNKKSPTCNSFKIVSTALEDKLLKAKLCFYLKYCSAKQTTSTPEPTPSTSHVNCTPQSSVTRAVGTEAVKQPVGQTRCPAVLPSKPEPCRVKLTEPDFVPSRRPTMPVLYSGQASVPRDKGSQSACQPVSAEVPPQGTREAGTVGKRGRKRVAEIPTPVVAPPPKQPKRVATPPQPKAVPPQPKAVPPQPKAVPPQPKAVPTQPKAVPTPPPLEEQVCLDSYYYGTVEGNAEKIENEYKTTLDLKCTRRPLVAQSVGTPPIWSAGGSGFESRQEVGQGYGSRGERLENEKGTKRINASQHLQILLQCCQPASVSNRCCVCHRKFVNNITLMKHLLMHVQSNTEFTTELSDLTQCKYCLKSFPTPFSMQTHMEELRHFAGWATHYTEEVGPVSEMLLPCIQDATLTVALHLRDVTRPLLRAPHHTLPHCIRQCATVLASGSCSLLQAPGCWSLDYDETSNSPSRGCHQQPNTLQQPSRGCLPWTLLNRVLRPGLGCDCSPSDSLGNPHGSNASDQPATVGDLLKHRGSRWQDCFQVTLSWGYSHPWCSFRVLSNYTRSMPFKTTGSSNPSYSWLTSRVRSCRHTSVTLAPPATPDINPVTFPAAPLCTHLTCHPVSRASEDWNCEFCVVSCRVIANARAEDEQRNQLYPTTPRLQTD
ncbi:hypothetical protein PR048_028859 [Dryococelus australis]|uniref:C2H2-type domain-containing protein n=1 Tax=Dryococelus australis TaxID=614101 RepID=A0ABQ9GBR1_9NEOP|nr:hypothetical protein PR048_028859 [Dryococelus australis]